jgi:hypothetical protein
MRSVVEIENDIINKFAESRKKLFKSIKFWKFQPKYSKAIVSIYFKRKGKGIKG